MLHNTVLLRLIENNTEGSMCMYRVSIDCSFVREAECLWVSGENLHSSQHAA